MKKLNLQELSESLKGQIGFWPTATIGIMKSDFRNNTWYTRKKNSYSEDEFFCCN
jgi:hypothetical protein